MWFYRLGPNYSIFSHIKIFVFFIKMHFNVVLMKYTFANCCCFDIYICSVAVEKLCFETIKPNGYINTFVKDLFR